MKYIIFVIAIVSVVMISSGHAVTEDPKNDCTWELLTKRVVEFTYGRPMTVNDIIENNVLKIVFYEDKTIIGDYEILLMSSPDDMVISNAGDFNGISGRCTWNEYEFNNETVTNVTVNDKVGYLQESRTWRNENRLSSLQ